MKTPIALIDVRQSAGLFNALIKKRNGERIVVEHRYNYYAIDLLDKAGNPRRTLKSQLTKHQAKMYVEAMIEGVMLYEKKPRRVT